MFNRILVAVDDTGTASDRALVLAAELASQSHADVGLLHVVNPPLPYSPSTVQSSAVLESLLLKEAEQLLKDQHARFERGLNVYDFVNEGHPADEIVGTARKWNADLIIVGDHNRHAFSRILLGSTADAVIRRAPCPVLVARGVETSADNAAARESPPGRATASAVAMK